MIQSGAYIFNKIIKFCRTVYYKFICHLIGIFFYPFFLIANVRFIAVDTARIGHLSLEPDCFIKEGILDMRPKYHGIMLAPHGVREKHRVANIHLLSYWRPYITIITSPLLRGLLDPFWHNRLTTFSLARYVRVGNRTGDYPKIQKKYFGRPPLLSLTEPDYKRGWAALRKLGIPHGAWFVCVHCREEGYVPMVNQTHRNANINNYFLCMEAIVKRGGWVIRMGDPTMENIPQMYHVIDYAHLDIKSDWMDIFLCASCKLYLGGDSGLFGLSSIFGVPLAIVNNSPMSIVISYGPCGIGIPKLVWSIKKECYLSFKEVFSSPIGNFMYDASYLEAGVRVVENSAEDIKDVAMEMMDRIEGKALYSDEDERLQERFKSLMNPSHYSYGSSFRVGRDFLRKYAYLLND